MRELTPSVFADPVGVHRPQDQEVLRDVLNGASDEVPRILLLCGESGIGRHYLLESAVYQARSSGTAIELVTLDLARIPHQIRAPSLGP